MLHTVTLLWCHCSVIVHVAGSSCSWMMAWTWTAREKIIWRLYSWQCKCMGRTVDISPWLPLVKWEVQRVTPQGLSVFFIRGRCVLCVLSKDLLWCDLLTCDLPVQVISGLQMYCDLIIWCDWKVPVTVCYFKGCFGMCEREEAILPASSDTIFDRGSLKRFGSMQIRQWCREKPWFSMATTQHDQYDQFSQNRSS